LGSEPPDVLAGARQDDRVAVPTDTGSGASNGSGAAGSAEVPDHANQLAAAGRVLDELGLPLVLVTPRILEWSADGEAWKSVTSRADGGFQVWTEPVQAVYLRCACGLFSNRFEPHDLTVPFGTVGIEFRREPRRTRVERTIRIVDQESGSGVERSWFGMWEPGERDRGTWSRYDAGPFDTGFPVGVPVVLTAVAPGYMDRELGFTSMPGDMAPIRIELERGFSRDLAILDCRDRRVLQWARILAGGRVVGVTDENGIAQVRLAAWPDVMLVECLDYETIEWNPAESPTQFEIRLCPAR
jgi:hypothetical protein